MYTGHYIIWISYLYLHNISNVNSSSFLTIIKILYWEHSFYNYSTYSLGSRYVYRNKILAKSNSLIVLCPLLNSWNSNSNTSCCKFSMKCLKSSYLNSLVPSLPKKCIIKVVSTAWRRCKPCVHIKYYIYWNKNTHKKTPVDLNIIIYLDIFIIKVKWKPFKTFITRN